MHAWCAAGVAPKLLPAVLMLLRTKSREVVKSVLGFVKVTDVYGMPLCRSTSVDLPAEYILCLHYRLLHRPWRRSYGDSEDCLVQVCAMRLPADVLEQHLRLILEGLLLWSEDSKNKFKLKVAFPQVLYIGLILTLVPYRCSSHESPFSVNSQSVDLAVTIAALRVSALLLQLLQNPVRQGESGAGDRVLQGTGQWQPLLLHGASDGWPQRSAGRPMQALRDGVQCCRCA